MFIAWYVYSAREPILELIASIIHLLWNYFFLLLLWGTWSNRPYIHNIQRRWPWICSFQPFFLRLQLCHHLGISFWPMFQHFLDWFDMCRRFACRSGGGKGIFMYECLNHRKYVNTYDGILFQSTCGQTFGNVAVCILSIQQIIDLFIGRSYFLLTLFQLSFYHFLLIVGQLLWIEKCKYSFVKYNKYLAVWN